MLPAQPLFSPEFEQAVKGRRLSMGFHYAVVAHDPDKGGHRRRRAQLLPVLPACLTPTESKRRATPQIPRRWSIPITSPLRVSDPYSTSLIVQSFNTAATVTSLRYLHARGGMGAQKRVFPAAQQRYGCSPAQIHVHEIIRSTVKPGNGGVKPASLDEWACGLQDQSAMGHHGDALLLGFASRTSPTRATRSPRPSQG